MQKEIVVSDICDTLFFMNTSFDFLNFCVRTEKLPAGKRRMHAVFLNRRSPAFWLLAIINKLTIKDLHRTIAVKLLKGQKKENVQKWATEFVSGELCENKVEPVFTAIASRNTELILASASFDVVVESVAKMLNARYICTELETSNGILTGKMTFDATGKKLQALVEKHHIDPSHIKLAISDNHSDRELLKIAKEAIAVCYTKEDEIFWKQIRSDIEILSVSRKAKSLATHK
ncbi:MAG: haloacid dehalogenase-like hydrolase [Chitinophagaceae bacterium]|nr:haloacid dehalogenase-like hydrolase [Chitinophagaceae bacterium]